MRDYASRLAARGYILRSGGATGADTAFKLGAGQHDIYLPWSGYNGQTGIVVGNDAYLRDISAPHHPAWAELTQGMRRLHTRNAAVICGHTRPLVLSDFVLCWTPRGRGAGGTGQAIRIAEAYHVPVYDLALPHTQFEERWLR
jgi:hypothetical protein